MTVNSRYHEQVWVRGGGGEGTHFVESRIPSVNLETRLSTMILGTPDIASWILSFSIAFLFFCKKRRNASIADMYSRIFLFHNRSTSERDN